MKSAAEAAFERQFGTKGANKQQQSYATGAKHSDGIKRAKIVLMQPDSRQNRCSCDCPSCGVPSSGAEEEKSTIGGGNAMDIDRSASDSQETDRAIKLKLSQTHTAVRCPKCHTRLRLQLGASVVVEDEESMDETDSMYEIRDAYEKWNRD